MKYDEFVKNHAGSLVEKLITEVLSREVVEVHFESDDKESWSTIKMHIYEEDKEIALQLLPDDKWFLDFGYYDEDDEFFEIVQPLTEVERDLIPKGLQKVMLRVLVSEEGLRLPGDFLSKIR